MLVYIYGHGKGAVLGLAVGIGQVAVVRKRVLCHRCAQQEGAQRNHHYLYGVFHHQYPYGANRPHGID